MTSAINKRVATALLLSLGLCGYVSQASAHPDVSGQIFIGDGPVSLGLSVGSLFYNQHHRSYRPNTHQHRGHQHGPACYRNYSHGHSHWQQWQAPAPRPHHQYQHHKPDHHKPEHHDRDHSSRHNAHPTSRHPRHNRYRDERRHAHSRDCYMHYPKGDAHWH